MNGFEGTKKRVDDVRRIFEECDFGNVEMLEGWDGHELDDLAKYLSEEEFQELVDRLADRDEPPGDVD